MADTSSDEVSARLQPDALRTLAAAVIAALTLGGWLYVLSKQDVLAAIEQQPTTWWVEQTVVLFQALLCLAIVARRPAARLPALIFTAAALLITAGAWIKGMQSSGRHPIPFTPIVQGLLLWRPVRSVPRPSERLAA